ncbi:MAG: type II secretion system protein [Lachnospiraceae bacterium]|nr:type II secretion system protein [Lachnospiraceae bacterium]
MKKMDNKGFSLVELIIVIAIMAILVGVLAPQFVKYVEQSRESSDLSSITEVKTAVETYVSDWGVTADCTVKAAGGATGISYTLGTSPNTNAPTDLSGYGIQDTTPQKSNKIAVDWTYSAFNWSGVDNSDSDAYYDAITGEKKN